MWEGGRGLEVGGGGGEGDGRGWGGGVNIKKVDAGEGWRMSFRNECLMAGMESR